MPQACAAPGEAAEIGDRVVEDSEPNHVGDKNRTIADAVACKRQLQRALNRISDDREVYETDHLQNFREIEDPDRADAAQAHVANAVARNGDVGEEASGHDRQGALAAGDGDGDLIGHRRRAIVLVGQHSTRENARIAAIGVEKRDASERNAVAGAAFDLVLDDENVYRPAGDLHSARSALRLDGADDILSHLDRQPFGGIRGAHQPDPIVAEADFGAAEIDRRPSAEDLSHRDAIGGDLDLLGPIDQDPGARRGGDRQFGETHVGIARRHLPESGLDDHLRAVEQRSAFAVSGLDAEIAHLDMDRSEYGDDGAGGRSPSGQEWRSRLRPTAGQAKRCGSAPRSL